MRSGCPGDASRRRAAARSRPGSRREIYRDRPRRLAARDGIRSPRNMAFDLKALIPVAGEPMVRAPGPRAARERWHRPGHRSGPSSRSESPPRCRPTRGCRVAESRDNDRRDDLDAVRRARTTQWPLLVTTADHALARRRDDRRILPRRRRRRHRHRGGRAGIADPTACRDSKRTWLKFRGGAYTGANLFALSSPKVAPAIDMWRSVEQDRKKGWRIVVAARAG